MKIDLYHLHRQLHFANFAYPIILNVLRTWTEREGWEVRNRVCRESQVDMDTDADVVGISVYTQTAPAAYRLADRLRRRGKIVVLGGPHFRGPATYPEAGPRCDLIVSSVSEGQWGTLLRDIAARKIRPSRPDALLIVDHEGLFRYPRTFSGESGCSKWYQIPSVPTSVGCPYNCSFCSPYLQGKYFLRDIDDIVNEVRLLKGGMVFLCDATFGLKKTFTLDLMRALAPLGKKIVVETTVARLKDREILDAMAAGGVKYIVFGIETMSLKLQKHGRGDLRESLERIIDSAHEKGMLVQGNLICGLDCDGPESFEKLSRFCESSSLDLVMAGCLTPYPNTSLYHEFQESGRIIDTDWEHYDCYHVVYRPLKMTINQLIDGYIELCRSLPQGKSLLGDAWSTYRTLGVSLPSTALVTYKAYHRLDVGRKEQCLRENQSQLPSYDSLPHTLQNGGGTDYFRRSSMEVPLEAARTQQGRKH